MLHPAANRHPKATHQWLLMGIQVCRLPALLQPTGTPGPYINGFSPRPHINGFFWASKSAVCQPSCSQQAPQGHTSMASYGRPSLPFASFQKMLPPKRWQRRVAWPTVTVGTSGGFYIMAYKLTLYLIWDLMDLAPTIFLLPYFSLNILEPPKG